MKPKGQLMTSDISIFRLNLLRAGYFLLTVGLGLTIWPEILDFGHMPELMRGVVISMLGAIAVVALLGLRYPLQTLPLLFFEITWKGIWLIRIALPLWLSHGFDAASTAMASAVLMVVIFPFVVPWDYVIRNYVLKAGDPWWSRSGARNPRHLA
jgi:hypothetical protein